MAATCQAAVSRWQSGAWSEDSDQLPVEIPVALRFNGVSHAVMLATPQDLPDFALGFSLSEGIVDHPTQLAEIRVEPTDLGVAIECRIDADRFALMSERKRSLSGRTGCGLCGVEELSQVFRALPEKSTTPCCLLNPDAIQRALDTLADQQPLNCVTGGMHAAAWCSPEGVPIHVCEDVGRHNALDKLIGWLARNDRLGQEGFVLISSRSSVEMVQKAAMVGIRHLVAISAPTALAVRMAKMTGMTLVAFARKQRFVAYANPQQISMNAS